MTDVTRDEQLRRLIDDIAPTEAQRARGQRLRRAARAEAVVERDAELVAAVERLARDRGDDEWDTVVRAEVLRLIRADS